MTLDILGAAVVIGSTGLLALICFAFGVVWPVIGWEYKELRFKLVVCGVLLFLCGTGWGNISWTVLQRVTGG